MNKIKDFISSSYMKFLVIFIIIHGMVCITLSYILAFMGRDAIAEDLSQVVVKEIIAPVIIYGVKALVENISKYNNWVSIINGGDINGEGFNDATLDDDICRDNDVYSEIS